MRFSSSWSRSSAGNSQSFRSRAGSVSTSAWWFFFPGGMKRCRVPRPFSTRWRNPRCRSILRSAPENSDPLSVWMVLSWSRANPALPKPRFHEIGFERFETVKVLGVSGSPRKGRTTGMLVKKVLEAVDCETEFASLAGKRIGPCIARSAWGRPEPTFRYTRVVS